jgi:hypothetical protein
MFMTCDFTTGGKRTGSGTTTGGLDLQAETAKAQKRIKMAVTAFRKKLFTVKKSYYSKVLWSSDICLQPVRAFRVSQSGKSPLFNLPDAFLA